MTNLNKEIEKLKSDRDVLISTLIFISFIFIITLFVSLHQDDKIRSKLYCEKEDYKYEYVYNKSSSNQPIGYRCCKKYTEESFDSKTGLWEEIEKEDCFYKPKFKVDNSEKLNIQQNENTSIELNTTNYITNYNTTFFKMVNQTYECLSTSPKNATFKFYEFCNCEGESSIYDTDEYFKNNVKPYLKYKYNRSMYNLLR